MSQVNAGPFGQLAATCGTLRSPVSGIDDKKRDRLGLMTMPQRE
jgi:hypothetical protein